MKRFALTAIGKDKPGIVASVTGALFRHGCNIEDSSMTILEDEFAMILITSAKDDMDANALNKELEEVGKKMSLAIHLKEIPIMEKAMPSPSTHIVTVSGCDRPGIVHKTASMLAEHGINITDLSTRVLHGDGKNLYIMLIEVSMPETTDSKATEKALKALGAGMDVKIDLKPIETCESL